MPDIGSGFIYLSSIKVAEILIQFKKIALLPTWVGKRDHPSSPKAVAGQAWSNHTSRF